MSYILDALKKADAEREQGAVPGLHSRPQAPAPDDDDEADARAGTQPVVWVGAGVALCLIAVLSWKLLSRDDVPPAPTVAMQTPPAGMATPPAPADVPAAPAPMAEPAMPPAATMQPPPQASHAPPTAPRQPFGVATGAPRSTTPGPASQAPVPANAAPAAPPAPAGTMQPPVDAGGRATSQAPAAPQGNAGATTATPGTATTAGQRVPALHELPDDVRRDIPQLTIGGAMYSETPSQRMLIVNSQVFREGDQPYQGLVLEEIRLKSAVFKYRGYQYSINY